MEDKLADRTGGAQLGVLDGSVARLADSFFSCHYNSAYTIYIYWDELMLILGANSNVSVPDSHLSKIPAKLLQAINFING